MGELTPKELTEYILEYELQSHLNRKHLIDYLRANMNSKHVLFTTYKEIISGLDPDICSTKASLRKTLKKLIGAEIIEVDHKQGYTKIKVIRVEPKHQR